MARYVADGYVAPGYVEGQGDEVLGQAVATKARVFVVELDVMNASTMGAEVKRFASRSFVTRSTDTPAHTFIPGRINKGLTIGRRITEAEDGQFGPLIKSRFGEIELNNVDGELDSLIDAFYIDGREIRVYVGVMETDAQGRELVEPFANFVLAYRARSGVWEAEHDVLRLKVEDRGQQLQKPFQSIYAGTGGVEGTSAIEGHAKPAVVGRVRNAPAQLLNSTLLIYQLNDGPIAFPSFGEMIVKDAGTAVPNDGGVGQIPSTDYADYDAIAAASPTAGQWIMSSADALIRFGTTPTGIVTADFATVAFLTDELHGNAIKNSLINRSPLTLGDLDESSFDALDAAQASPMGIFFESRAKAVTIEEAVAQMAFSAGAFIGQDRSGSYRVQRLEVPSGTPEWIFGENDIIAIEREPAKYGVPWQIWRVVFNRNWRVMSDTDLATGVQGWSGLRNEGPVVSAEETDIATAHPTTSQAPLRQSLFVGSFDSEAPDVRDLAQSEANRLIALYDLGRAIYRVTVKATLFEMDLGDVVRITYPRWNLSGGRTFVVVEINDDADRVETEMRLFG